MLGSIFLSTEDGIIPPIFDYANLLELILVFFVKHYNHHEFLDLKLPLGFERFSKFINSNNLSKINNLA